MTKLGASYPMVFAVKLATRLSYTVEDVLDMPLAKALSYDSALQVLDGTKPASTIISDDDKEIVKFLSKNQEDVIKKFKNMRGFKE